MFATIGEKVLKPCSDFVFAFSVFCFPGALDNEVSGENVGQWDVLNSPVICRIDNRWAKLFTRRHSKAWGFQKGVRALL